MYHDIPFHRDRVTKIRFSLNAPSVTAHVPTSSPQRYLLDGVSIRILVCSRTCGVGRVVTIVVRQVVIFRVLRGQLPTGSADGRRQVGFQIQEFRELPQAQQAHGKDELREGCESCLSCNESKIVDVERPADEDYTGAGSPNVAFQCQPDHIHVIRYARTLRGIGQRSSQQLAFAWRPSAT